MSDIQVSVKWKDSTVFAGERIECKITFKNVSQAPSNRRSPSPSSQLLGHTTARDRWKETLPLQPKPSDGFINSSPNLSIPQRKLRTHRPTASHSGPSSIKPSSGTTVRDRATNGTQSLNHSHRKSVSIISLAGEELKGSDVQQAGGDSLRRPGGGYARAASLQVLPKRNGTLASGPLSAPTNDRATTMPSPLFRSSTSSAELGSGSDAANYRRTQRSPTTGPTTSRHFRKASETFSNFRFPRVPASIDELFGQGSNLNPNNLSDEAMVSLPSGPLGPSNVQDQVNPSTSILSPTSMNGTPRSSGDFYSISNNSTETLASEYVTHDTSCAVHHRQTTLLASIRNNKPPEVLMMGYGQITGSYILDRSLVDQAPFEDVKRKGIIGSKGGGGVVRNDSAQRDSGFLGVLGLGNIGDSLGGLLGGNELSSIKEIKGSDKSKSIPILSTPQAILFVNLKLAPGESKTYSYSHPLPKDIPPTYRGRAIKVSYKLIVGTQRAAKAAQQHHVRQVDFPFRVLPSVNNRGEVLDYNLMSPHIMLHNDASISSMDDNELTKANIDLASAHGKYNASIQSFLSYVEHILDRPGQSSSLGLLSPTESGHKSLTVGEVEADTAKDAIDLAILQSNSTTSSKRSPNRFEITRSGTRVAVIMLARPAYRLGETITAVVDFQGAEVWCHSLNATLETSETVDSTIALRSKASIHRATRRIHASQSEFTIFATRVVFGPMIPSSATPNFITSGVNLEWKLRFEFVTGQAKNDSERQDDLQDLLEEVSRDDRGSVMAGVPGLPCETFDVTVPLRIYGANVGYGEKHETGEFPI